MYPPPELVGAILLTCAPHLGYRDGMRRIHAWAVLALTLPLALSGCFAPSCDAPSSVSIPVHAAKPGTASVQCWSGCAPGARTLEPVADGEWTAQLDDHPASVTLAARDESGELRFAQRFNLEWQNCSATPRPVSLELLAPEGGTGGEGGAGETGG